VLVRVLAYRKTECLCQIGNELGVPFVVKGFCGKHANLPKQHVFSVLPSSCSSIVQAFVLLWTSTKPFSDCLWVHGPVVGQGATQ
jgi:hypothetical protein